MNGSVNSGLEGLASGLKGLATGLRGPATGLTGFWKAAGELGAVFAALGAAPLAPVLAASYLGLPWEAVALGGAWAVSWWTWLAARLRGGGIRP